MDYRKIAQELVESETSTWTDGKPRDGYDTKDLCADILKSNYARAGQWAKTHVEACKEDGYQIQKTLLNVLAIWQAPTNEQFRQWSALAKELHEKGILDWKRQAPASLEKTTDEKASVKSKDPPWWEPMIHQWQRPEWMLTCFALGADPTLTWTLDRANRLGLEKEEGGTFTNTLWLSWMTRVVNTYSVPGTPLPPEVNKSWKVMQKLLPAEDHPHLLFCEGHSVFRGLSQRLAEVADKPGNPMGAKIKSFLTRLVRDVPVSAWPPGAVDDLFAGITQTMAEKKTRSRLVIDFWIDKGALPSAQAFSRFPNTPAVREMLQKTLSKASEEGRGARESARVRL